MLPAAGALSWEEVSLQNGMEILRLTGLTLPVLAAEASPEGRWWALTLMAESFYGGSTNALILVDSQSDHHWTAAEDFHSGYQRYLWLAGERLIWIQDGDLFLAESDGSKLRQIASPEPVIELTKISDRRIFVGGEEHLWRLDLSKENWDRVTGINSNNPRPPASSPSSRLSMDRDGSYAMLLNLGEVWRIPVEDNVSAVWLNAYSYGGRGGRIAPLLSLSGSPYWIILQQLLCSQGGALIDARDGQIILFDEFLSGAAADKGAPTSDSAAGFRKLFGGGPCWWQFRTSLDGRWLESVYSPNVVVLSSDPSVVVSLSDHNIKAWQSESTGIFVTSRTDPARPLSWMPLPFGERELLWPDTAQFLYYEVGSTG